MEVKTQNIESVTINTINQSDQNTMIDNALINGKPLYWANGILFSFEPYGITDWTAQEAAEGRIYYFSLTWTTLESFVPSLSDANNQQVPISNLDHHAFWKEILTHV